ncbi:MAG TPA: DinB family protein [Terriglobales bacterium]|nr:DinB family protein [Terriglobales bacterium]
MGNGNLAEPWLRGTLTDVPPVLRAVLHALELAQEDVERWCFGLSAEELNSRPEGIASVSFHLRHIPGSVDRLLTYAEGRALSPEQLAALKHESEPVTSPENLFAEYRRHLTESAERIRRFDATKIEESRTVGKKQLPTTVAGLLVHVADHTHRHVGQAVTTAKIVLARRVTSAAD